MGKTSEMATAIEELRNAAATIKDTADWLAQYFINPDEPEQEKQDHAHTFTLEEVRAKLANKSRQGYTAEVKALLVKYGADKLSAIDPAKYGELMAEAEVLGNG
ncbi:MAG: DNA ligase [[Eubacterium] siraeum]